MRCARRATQAAEAITATQGLVREAIRSYLSTAAKHSLDVFDSLVMLTKGQPWMPAA